jgi:hypothetical protein
MLLPQVWAGAPVHAVVTNPVQLALQVIVPLANPCVMQVLEFNAVPSQISVPSFELLPQVWV